MDTTIKRDTARLTGKIVMPVILCMFWVIGCEDVFEKDLSKKEVVLVAPGDSIRTSYEQQVFVWEEIEGATGYRLIIVSPQFERPERCLLDTLVAGRQFSFTLKPGEYQWRVRPENSAYEGIYSTRTIIVLLEENES